MTQPLAIKKSIFAWLSYDSSGWHKQLNAIPNKNYAAR